MLPPAEWVHGDPERDEMMPEDKYRSVGIEPASVQHMGD